MSSIRQTDVIDRAPAHIRHENRLLRESLRDHDAIPDNHYWRVMFGHFEAAPHRFEHYHPTAGKLLREYEHGDFRLPTLPIEPGPSGGTVAPAPAPGGGPTAAVPEPPSLTLVTFVVIGFVLGHAERRLRRNVNRQ